MQDYEIQERTSEKILLCVALLAGLGSQAQSIVAALCNEIHAPALTARTCVDGGNSLMFSLLAPGERSLRVLSRLPESSQIQQVAHWQRVHYLAGDRTERWRTEAFAGETEEAWQRVQALVQKLGREHVMRRYHAALGPLGRIFNISYQLEPEVESGWVSWQLDRHISPQEALAACGVGQSWPVAAELLQHLFGHPIAPQYGPWSIAWSLNEQTPHLRIGTTSWARTFEDVEKRRRLVSLMEQMGGDGRFTEVLYKLLAAERPSGSFTRIGRAIEIELCDNQVRAVEAYLCMPQPKQPPLHAHWSE